MKKLRLYIIFIIFVFTCFIVKPKALDYGDCITNYGKISFVEFNKTGFIKGFNTYDFPNIENNSDWNNTPVSFWVEIRPGSSGARLTSIKYSIYNGGSVACSSKIEGLSFEKGTSVKFNVTINKGKVEKMSFAADEIDMTGVAKDLGGQTVKIKFNANAQVDANGNLSNGGSSSDDELSYDDTKSKVCDSQIRGKLRYYWRLLTISMPILLIILISLDVFKAITSDDAEQLKKSGSRSVKRTIACLLLLLLPWLLGFILEAFGLELCF